MDRSIRYFKYVKKILSLAGLWHTQTRRERLLRYYIIEFMSLHCVLNEICQLYTSSFDLRSAIRILQVFMPTICGLAIYYPFILHFKTVRKIYTFILHDSRLLNDDIEQKIMQTYAHYADLISFAGFVMLYSYFTVNVSSSLLRIILSTNEIRSDLDFYPIISCFDYISNRETYYYPVIIYQALTSLTVITVSIACYTNMFTFFLHACARLSIIKYKIHSPFIHYNSNDDVLVKPIDLSPWIIDIIKRLTRTTEFMNLINTVFESSNLFQISLAFFLLMLDFLCISTLLAREILMTDVVTFIIYVSGTLFIIYICCLIGQKLIDYSADIYREVCQVPFHNMSLKTQKLLLITLMMCAKPHAASIGKVYVASHEFFSNLLRTSLSFAMVIHSLGSA